MRNFPTLVTQEDLNNRRPRLGLISPASDILIERDFWRMGFAAGVDIFTTRIPLEMPLTPVTLARLADGIGGAMERLLPEEKLDAVVFGCTSGSAVIGPAEVERFVKAGCRTKAVTNPLTAAVAACRDKGISRLALLSPYIEEVNIPLIEAFAAEGIEFAAVATFDEAVEERVVRISHKSVVEAACKVGADKGIEGVFMSCTNLRTFDAIGEVSSQLKRPALSSNQVLSWHMGELKKDSCRS